MSGVKGQKHINKRRKGIVNHRTHGLSNTRLYRIWANMKNRCSNPNCNRAHIYKHRNITVCEEWLNDFRSFYEWSIQHGYDDSRTLDRIDNNWGYSPANCRWVDVITQQRNKRNITTYTYGGVVFRQCEVFDLFGVKRTTFQRRINAGMSVKQAIEKR